MLITGLSLSIAADDFLLLALIVNSKNWIGMENGACKFKSREFFSNY